MLPRAILAKADLRYAQLQGALLDDAQLQGASLDGAQLPGASLYSAQLQGVSLNFAQLQGALLDVTQLQGARLWGARLQGASLREAQQARRYYKAELQGARLWGPSSRARRLGGPGEWQEDHLPAKFVLAWPREQLFDGHVDLLTRRRESLFSNTLVLPAFNIYEALKIDDPKKVEWKQTLIDLRGRDLNGAMFTGAILNKVDFSVAQLQGASLVFAQLQGASFEYAQLQSTSLGDAQLQGASLDGAQLQGASLNQAQLQGASLGVAQLQGASLNQAQLQGASLGGAQLQGASLDFAQLQGAQLFGAQLQSASLDSTGLWRAQLGNSIARDLLVPVGSPDWSPEQADPLAIPSHRQPWTDATYAELRRSIERAVPEGRSRDRALERVAILDCAQRKWEVIGEEIVLASCDPAAEPPDTVKEGKRMIEAASVNRAAYAKALAAFLGGLVCSNEPDRIYVLRGLMRFGPLLKTGAEMPALAKRITSPECPISTALTDADKTAIAAAAKEAVSSSKSP